VAGARLFESTFGMSYETALWAGAAATILYTFVGGFLAVSWTDTAGEPDDLRPDPDPGDCDFHRRRLWRFAGSDQAEEHRKRRHAERAELRGDYFADGLGPGLFRSAAYSGALYGGGFAPQHRSCPSHQYDLDDPLPGGACAVGFFGIAYFNNNPAQAGAVNQNAERVFIELAQILFNPWIAGILLSAILAAVMSTLSCQLLVCSSAITEDLYKAFLRKNAGQKELVWVGRFMVLVVALVAIALAANPKTACWVW
jgi:sodium/proline symporter